MTTDSAMPTTSDTAAEKWWWEWNNIRSDAHSPVEMGFFSHYWNFLHEILSSEKKPKNEIFGWDEALSWSADFLLGLSSF